MYYNVTATKVIERGLSIINYVMAGCSYYLVVVSLVLLPLVGLGVAALTVVLPNALHHKSSKTSRYK